MLTALFRRIVGRYFDICQFRINLRFASDKLAAEGIGVSGRVLDIGAGDQPYRECFPNVSEYVATNTRGHYAEAQLAEIERATDVWIEDATSLPFENGSFDVALCFQVLSLIQDPDAFFREVARVLKPGGALLLTTDFLYPKWDEHDVMRYTDSGLRHLAEDAGFKIEKLQSFGGFFTMIHCCVSRYIRDYPQTVTAASGIPEKLRRIVILGLYMILTPFYSLAGWVVYMLERNRTRAFPYTVAHLLICRKAPKRGQSSYLGIENTPPEHEHNHT